MTVRGWLVAVIGTVFVVFMLTYILLGHGPPARPKSTDRPTVCCHRQKVSPSRPTGS